MRLSFPVFITIITLVACQDNSKQPAEAKQVAQYTIDQFYKSSHMDGGDFSSDEKKLLVSSDESGIYNVYELDIATGQKKALTHSAKESTFEDEYVPGTLDFIYDADKGGNENNHLFLQRADGSVKELTSGTNEKASLLRWSRDKKGMYYTSNKRDARFFDLYKADSSTWKPVMLYKNDSGYDVSALTDNEHYLAANQSITTSSSNLYLVDLQGKKSKKINSDSVESNNAFQTFSHDNKSLYYTTDEGSEFMHLIKYDIESGKKENLFSTNWDVFFMRLSYNDKYRIIGVNEDGVNKIYLFDNKTGDSISFPKIEGGAIISAKFSPSETKMELYVGDSKSPFNIYLYDFGTKELKKLTNTLTSEIKESDLVDASVVRYKSFDGLDIPAIYYKPQQASATNKVPALVWVHGGPGGQSVVSYFPLIQYLVNHGYAILAVNNRGSSGYGKTFFKMDDRDHGNKDLKDCVWGKKYLASLPYIDSTKIGIIGGSYGGFMTLAALCFQPDEFKVGVDLFGVANWLRTLKEIPPYWESFKKALYVEMGDPNTADTVMLKQYSPLLHADQVKKPLMVLQGANDPRVKKIESDEIVATVKKSNVPVEYVVFPDEGHGFLKKENEIKGYGQILQFLDEYLNDKPAKKSN